VVSGRKKVERNVTDWRVKKQEDDITCRRRTKGEDDREKGLGCQSRGGGGGRRGDRWKGESGSETSREKVGG
jgi:hypothetical protein